MILVKRVQERKNIYFISDVHLKFVKDEQEKIKQDKLINFLKSIEDDAKELYILGDLFDFWFEWNFTIPKFWFNVFFQFKVLIQNGVKVSFISGNHDFHFNTYLKNEIGFICYDEKTEFEIETDAGRKKFFLAHGDGYAKKDKGYRVLKKIIRNKFSIFLFKKFVHPDIGMWLAKKTSETSGKHRNDGLDWQEEYFEFAKSKFKEDFDFVLLGHLHKPMIKKVEEKVYINCGDWINSFSYAVFDGKDLLLTNLYT